MRILYITPFVPWPVRARSFNFIPRLARRHEVHLVALARSDAEAARTGYVTPHCASVRVCRHRAGRGLVSALMALPLAESLREAFFRSTAMGTAVRSAITRISPDVILVERWRALQYVPPGCGIPVVCDATDSMTLYNRRLGASGTAWERAIAKEEYWKFRRREAQLVMRTAASIFCSRDDIAAVPGAPSNCVHIRNGVDLHVFRRKAQAQESPATILFWGNFSYRPNRLGVDYFLERIFPVVSSQVPQVRFEAIGNDATRVLRGYASRAGVSVRDFLPDLQPAIATATVAVAPMTIGAGTSNKVLQAFAVGTPVVATPIACGDLPVADGRHLLITADASRFAASVVSLLRDFKLRQALAGAARALVEQHFDWDIVTRELEGLLLRCSGDRSREALAEVV